MVKIEAFDDRCFMHQFVTLTNVRMYVCIYICMYACVYVCMYVLYGCIYANLTQRLERTR